MRTQLVLERYKEGALLERRRQWSRSFTKGLFQLLYLAHAQIQQASPYTAIDIMGQAREMDSEAQANYVRGYKATLQVAAPPGGTGIFCPTGSWLGDTSNEYTPSYSPLNFLLGDAIGIQVGAGTDTVAPDDAHLSQRVFHGTKAAVASTAIFDAYTTGDDQEDAIYGTDRLFGALFLPTRGFRMSSVRLLLYRAGLPGTLNIGIRGIRYGQYGGYCKEFVEATDIVSGTTDGNTLPTSSPYEWREVALTSPVDVHPGFAYVILLGAPGGDASNYVRWRREYIASDYHPRYGQIYTTNGGLDWNLFAYNRPMFETRGMALAELEYGGCEIFGLNITNPNGQFSIRRLFTNNSGGSLTVNECGLSAVGTSFLYDSGSNYYYQRVGTPFSFCIARDLISPGIAVANGEVLAVTYVPQITA